MSFSKFGDPDSAIDISSAADWLGIQPLSGTLGSYYTPPINLKGLARLTKSNPHHGTLPSFKANLLVINLKPNALVSKKTLRKAAIDFNTFGMCYFKLIRNNAGQVIEVGNLPAINMRRKPQNLFCYLNIDGTITDFMPGEVVQIIEYDTEQQIYGIPYWFGALQSILLAEDSRLFFRRFFRNGAHTGFLVATSGLKEDEKTALDKAINAIKGIGKWLSMHVALPSGKIDETIKILPISSEGAKIEYAKLMGVSTDEIMEAWRIPPQLAGMLPDINGNTGDLDKVVKMYHEHEIIPFQDIMSELNNFLPFTAFLQFENPYLQINTVV
ncbi:portal vertex protein [uncultured Caudovirales phage]|uniref:Portal vertex protein n=1 Tax=uncultured Caudovirales phage TaxID=2100421 RepID=A0A6J5S2Z2_9CAUD|nr:portal protein [uncultured Caudovirales phage]CAB4202829.1 portal vertex protein [uncultured Caudovirales phage]